MRFFKLIQSGIDPQPFLSEIAGVEGAWDAATGRQAKIAVQREALSIPLRGARRSAMAGREVRDVLESRWTTGSASYPVARAFLEQAAEALESQLGRAKIVCLPAGHRVYPHIDRGRYYEMHNRYHVVLVSTQGSWLKAADEEVRMQTGQWWWFDNDQIHEARNEGTADRIHMIFDLLPNHRLEEARAAMGAEVEVTPA
ncbi:MAG: hypothetical protein B7Y36_08950 [Novosphingobium sp. 28-62-57]|uniref:aspartyl/asparaginyl beta-hydroxylase domain-containing protein n=1 Tax=unclassified Novosphingobium TaxID=2644732 RepID=UPI000BDA507D|nr:MULTISPECIES: aspartyl/asparaginyl beta-hydroxylase domain-containing protein [unclassified Novosphingobium]OYW51270.1 MAG: hypothetical protein B7Z34_00180 [Novosphingobium sp. 12-62-10]OYZ10349.1 MAG: hypothetical protein B7Y36_08950 [Novosphingobium sp. 28-62-57]OZA37199.1 MAG: hypothetical protein B7X92_05150 [Novosphingobium sp. 17-62-9]HQS68068.1 aspartyl/asparaginyl beta-hydroxylase domain-containing protein [Novosphingobium sp.]